MKTAPTTADLLESGERLCEPELFVRARRCESSFPGVWLDTADLTVLHDESAAICECSGCHDVRRAKIRAFATPKLEAISERLLAEMYALPSDNDNCDDSQRCIETSRPPARFSKVG